MDRLWSKIEDVSYLTDEDCWNWIGYCCNGYPSMFYLGRAHKATRLIYWFYKESLPLLIENGGHEFLEVCHTCDNRKCVNLSHLFLGTRKENAEDCKNKGRVHIPQGTLHGNCRLSPEQVIEIRAKYKQGISQPKLGVIYGVNYKHINAIVLRKTWRHI